MRPSRSLQPTSRFAQSDRFNKAPRLKRRASLVRIGAFLVLITLLGSGIYSATSASSGRRVSAKRDSAAATGAALPGAYSKGGGSAVSTLSPSSGYRSILAPLFSGPPTVQTYTGDCSMPKDVYNLQDTDKTVCARVTGASAGWQVIWSNADFIAVQTNTLTAGDQDVTFTLSTGSSLGEWRVILYEPFGGAVYALTPFTVTDANNPNADLTIAVGSSSATVASGAQVVFTIQVTNLGPDDATNVQITDALPANTTLSSFGLASGPGDTNCVQVGDNTICTIPTLARGSTAMFLATYGTSGVSAGADISNTASVASVTVGNVNAIPDPKPDNNSSTADITVVGATSDQCVLDPPANVVATADTTVSGQSGAYVNFAAASIKSGNCGTITNNPPSGSFFTVGTHSVVSSSELGGGSVSFTVTVLDTNPPTISCPADVTVTAPVNATEATIDTQTIGTPTSNASGGGTVTFERSDGAQNLTDPYPLGTTGILWTVTDAGGRKASCTQKVVVLVNNRPPVTISCPANVSYTTTDGSCQATISLATIGTPTTNPSDPDVEVIAVRNDSRPLTDPFPAGVTTITWTATDNQTGSVASCTQTVTIIAGNGHDTTPPTLDIPPNINTTTSSCTAIINDEALGTAQASDTGSCGGTVTVTRIGVPAGNAFPTGTTTIIYTATDAAGNITQKSQLVTVTESPAVPPTITAPPNVTVNTGTNATSCGAVVSDATLGTATASDNCALKSVTRTGVPAGNVFPVGDTFVTYTATDQSGNTKTATQKVTVIDNAPPVVTAPPTQTLYTGAGATSCGVTVTDLDGTLGTGSAVDNCTSPLTVTRSGVPAGGTFQVGVTYTITYSATDASGNTGSATQTVTVVDNTPPVISCPANITVYLPLHTTDTSMPVSYPAATATDNCSVASITYSKASGSVFNIGTTPVTATATDAAGLTASCTFNVTVLYDFTGFFSPVANLPTLNVVNAGRAIPVKFSLSGNKGLNIFAVGYPQSGVIPCDASAPATDLTDTVTAGGSSLSYDATSDQYDYIWKTDSAWAGTCRQFVVVLNDGSPHVANFKFK